MVRRHVREIRGIVRRTNDAPDYRVHSRKYTCSRRHASGFRLPSSGYHCLALLPFGPIVVSKSLKIRPYSSVQLAGRTNPWFSTG